MSWLPEQNRGAFVRLTGVLFLVYLGQGLWSPLMAVYAGSLGAQTGQIGLVLASYQLATLASQYWWGQRSDRLGRRKPQLLVGTAGLALAYLLIAGVGHYGWLFAARVLEGLAMAAYTTGSLALMGDLLEDQARRGRLMGFYRTFGSLAFSFAALGGGWLADTFGIRVPFLVAAGCYALACALGAGIAERPAPPAREPLARGADEPALPADPQARRALWPFLGVIFTWMFGMGAVVSLWPVYMASVGYSKTAVGGLWALAALGEVPWLIVAGHLADRWGRKWVILTGLTCMAMIYTAYTISSAPAWMIGVQMVRSFAYSCFEAPALLYATELGLRRQRGRLAGLYYSASGLGGISGSTIGGFVAQQTGLPLMYRGVVVLMLLVALLAARIMPRLRTADEEQIRQGSGFRVQGSGDRSR